MSKDSERPTVDATDEEIRSYAIKHGFGLQEIEYISLTLPYDGAYPTFEVCRIDWKLPGSPITRNINIFD